MSTGHGHGDDAIDIVLSEHGIRLTPQDDLVVFRTIYEDRSGQPIPASRPPVLLYAKPQLRR
ncbi:hypothetical protein [Rhizobium sp. Rhizsp82]|uniref:hypothetical protein n=1 Tax=Rhizobium sp. Rhizsp82 TaxID=3243057 RepID=UPI0039B4CEC0